MATPSVNISSALNNGVAPCEGSKCVPFSCDFNTASQFDFDFTAAQQNGQISSIQTVYVDNSANGNSLTLSIDGTQQTIVVPPNSCGYFLLLAPMATVVHATTTGLVKVYFGFLNFYVPPTVWSTI